jgi:hypothetical protein
LPTSVTSDAASRTTMPMSLPVTSLEVRLMFRPPMISIPNRALSSAQLLLIELLP